MEAGDLSNFAGWKEITMIPKAKYLALSGGCNDFRTCGGSVVMALSYRSVLINIMIAVILVAIGVILAIQQDEQTGIYTNQYSNRQMAKLKRKKHKKSVSGFLAYNPDNVP